MVASLVGEHGLSATQVSVVVVFGLSICGAWALVALQHVGSSWSRDGTYVPCVGRWILYHRATGEVCPIVYFHK